MRTMEHREKGSKITGRQAHAAENSRRRAYACLLEFACFEPMEYAALYTQLRIDALERIVPEKARTQSAAAELAYLAAARAACGGMFGACAVSLHELKARFDYSYAETGKPVLEDVFMSLSHTSHAALAVIAPFAVGADIEHERRVSERIAKRIMSESEYAEFRLLDETEKNARILEYWTWKESFLKLTGEGILAGLDKLSCDRENAKVYRAETGESASLIRIDTVSRAQCECESTTVGEAAGKTGGERLFACICCKDEAELVLLRFSSAQEAASFILGNER